MNAPRGRRQWFLLMACVLLPATAFAQTPVYAPEVGQPGKDVVWVPTPQTLVDKMLDMAKVTPQDFLMDLGSGDGRTVITAAKRGIRAMGVEYNPDMVQLSKSLALKEGITERASFVQADIFETDFSNAQVITMFLLPSINMKLRPTLLNLKPGTRIVSNTFTMEDWTADQTETVTDCPNYCTAYLWVVPAKAQGTWKTPEGALVLTQEFQLLKGTLNGTPISGRMNGDLMTIDVPGRRYTGRVSADGRSITGPSLNATKLE